MLTRIYGTAFETENELNTFLKNQELLRVEIIGKIGKQLELFAIIPEIVKDFLFGFLEATQLEEFSKITC